MDKIHELVRKIRTCKIDETDRVCNLIGRLRAFKEEDSDLCFFGIAAGLEKIFDYRIFELRNDSRLDELNQKINKVREREGLDELETFVPGDPDTPEDYQALNNEFEYRIDEIRYSIMKEFDEKEMADLFAHHREQYIRRYHQGWRIFEKNNPKAIKKIDEAESLELKELGFK